MNGSSENPDWADVERALSEALELPEEQQAAFLAKLPSAVRAEVQSLLQAHLRAASFLEGETSSQSSAGGAGRHSAIEANTQIGSYRIEATIGEGGMGVVYRALDTKLNRPVAVKFLYDDLTDAAAQRRFQREAKIVSSLNHPHILTVYDTGEFQGCQYIVTEFMDAGTLRSWALAEKHTWREIVTLLIGVADGLAAAHSAGILHRDIKPDNILVGRNGYAKLADFGLAKLEERVASEAVNKTVGAPTTRRGILLGTIAYMSPEQASGRPTDARSDIFSFGIVMYELLASRRPFEGQNDLEVLQSIIHGMAAPLAHDVPLVLRMIVEKAIEKDPADRYQGMRDLVVDLRRLTRQGGDIGDARSAKGELPVESPRLSRRWWMTALATLTLGALGIWVWSSFRQPPAQERVFSFEIDPPEGGHFARGTNETGIALSPDGKTAVFVATANGKAGLWVRPLDGTTAKLLPGTEGAGHPFWSPDSASIAFFVNGKLQRIDPAGGTPQPICEIDSARGGSWGENGQILFGQSGAGIFQVSASGGRPTPLTTPAQVRREMFHYWPQMLPGGHFLYFARSTNSEYTGVYAASLANPREPVQLLRTDANAWYAPAGGTVNHHKGHLLWLRGATLLAQPFDADKLQLSGEARAIASPVAKYGVSGQMYLSVSATGILLYGGSYTLNQFTWVDRSGKALGTVGEPLTVGPFELSPDGRRVAFAVPNSAGTDLWMLDVDRAVVSRFTSRLGQSISPIWSPDGRSVVFASGPPFIMYRKDSSGAGGEERLIQTANTQIPSDWSRDGRFILYHGGSQGHRLGTLWILPMRPSGGQPRSYSQTEFAEDMGRFSPDGHWVAFQSDESGRNEVYVDSFPEPHGRVRISTSGGTFPQWGASERELFYISADSKLMAVSLALSAESMKPSAPRALFALGLYDAGLNPYIAARDGQRFLVNKWIENKPPLTVIVNWPALVKKATVQ